MRIYLDVCCLNRPLDDLSIGRNRLEAEAVLEILRHVQEGRLELIGSDVIEAELSVMPSSDRREKVLGLAALHTDFVQARQSERARAVGLAAMGISYMDALHIACAESGRCDAFLSTDDRLFAKLRDRRDDIMVRLANPLQWIAEVKLP